MIRDNRCWFIGGVEEVALLVSLSKMYSLWVIDVSLEEDHLPPVPMNTDVSLEEDHLPPVLMNTQRPPSA